MSLREKLERSFMTTAPSLAAAWGNNPAWGENCAKAVLSLKLWVEKQQRNHALISVRKMIEAAASLRSAIAVKIHNNPVCAIPRLEDSDAGEYSETVFLSYGRYSDVFSEVRNHVAELPIDHTDIENAQLVFYIKGHPNFTVPDEKGNPVNISVDTPQLLSLMNYNHTIKHGEQNILLCTVSIYQWFTAKYGFIVPYFGVQNAFGSELSTILSHMQTEDLAIWDNPHIQTMSDDAFYEKLIEFMRLSSLATFLNEGSASTTEFIAKVCLILRYGEDAPVFMRPGISFDCLAFFTTREQYHALMRTRFQIAAPNQEDLDNAYQIPLSSKVTDFERYSRTVQINAIKDGTMLRGPEYAHAFHQHYSDENEYLYLTIAKKRQLSIKKVVDMRAQEYRRDIGIIARSFVQTTPLLNKAWLGNAESSTAHVTKQQNCDELCASAVIDLDSRARRMHPPVLFKSFYYQASLYLKAIAAENQDGPDYARPRFSYQEFKANCSPDSTVTTLATETNRYADQFHNAIHYLSTMPNDQKDVKIHAHCFKIKGHPPLQVKQPDGRVESINFENPEHVLIREFQHVLRYKGKDINLSQITYYIWCTEKYGAAKAYFSVKSAHTLSLEDIFTYCDEHIPQLWIPAIAVQGTDDQFYSKVAELVWLSSQASFLQSGSALTTEIIMKTCFYARFGETAPFYTKSGVSHDILALVTTADQFKSIFKATLASEPATEAAIKQVSANQPSQKAADFYDNNKFMLIRMLKTQQSLTDPRIQQLFTRNTDGHTVMRSRPDMSTHDWVKSLLAEPSVGAGNKLTQVN